MEPKINPYFTQPDIVVLQNLIQDVKYDVRGDPGAQHEKPAPEVIESCSDIEIGEHDHDKQSISLLEAYNDPSSAEFAPTIFTSWDDKDIPEFLNYYIFKLYTRIAVRIVRHPTDVVFLTHIIEYMTINLGSAIWLYCHFSYLHGVAHTVYTAWCVGSFTLMMHNHIHNKGILSRNWAWLDMTFPYLLEPLMGHTWDSYFYHHVKHHHVESNGMSQFLPSQGRCCLSYLHANRCARNRSRRLIIHNSISARRCVPFLAILRPLLVLHLDGTASLFHQNGQNKFGIARIFLRSGKLCVPLLHD